MVTKVLSNEKFCPAKILSDIGLSDKVQDFFIINTFITEAVVLRCSVKDVFFEISQNLQENTCSRVSFLIKSQA